MRIGEFWRFQLGFKIDFGLILFRSIFGANENSLLSTKCLKIGLNENLVLKILAPSIFKIQVSGTFPAQLNVKLLNFSLKKIQ